MEELKEIEGVGLYAENNNILFKFSSAYSKLSETKVNPTEAPLDDKTSSLSVEYANYGSNNAYPNMINKIISMNNTLSGGIPKRICAIIGKGIKTKRWFSETETEVVRYKPFVEFQRNHADFVSELYAIFSDLLVDRWACIEYLFNSDGSQIVGIACQRTNHVRLGYSRTKRKRLPFVHINNDWQNNNQDVNIVTIPELEGSHYLVDKLKQRNHHKNMAKVLMIPHNEAIYPKSAIHALVEQGWVDISQDEATYIKALIQNKTSVLTVINIKDWYWPAKFGADEWRKFSPEEKRAKKQAEVLAFNQMVAGATNAGKTLMVDVKTEFLLNQTKDGQTIGKPSLDKMMAAWEITSIDMPKMDGTLTESAAIARKECLWAIGLDWLTTGGVTQQNQTGGSAKQQSKTIEMILDEYLREMVIQQFQFIARFNGWDDAIEFEFDLPTMPTLATMSPSDRQITPAM